MKHLAWLLLILSGGAWAAEATVVDSVAVGAADNTTTLETGSLTVSGTNRILYVLAGSGAGTAVDPSAVRWGGSGGTSLSQLGSTLNPHSNVKMSLWRLIAPAATASTVHVTWGSNQDERWIIAVAVQDADQGSPNGTVATATGNSSTITVNATSVAGQLVLDFTSFGEGGGGSRALTAGASQSQLENIAGGAFAAFEGAAASSETAAGTSTTMSWTVNGGSSVEWGTFAFAVNAATGGDPAPAITDVDGDDAITSDQADIVITGADFDAATVDIEQGAVAVAQSIDSQDADEIQFDATFDTGSDDLKHGAATLRVTNGDDQDDTIAITISAPSGHLYVDIGTPETEAENRITAVADIESGDQLQVRGQGGGAVPAGLQIFDDGTFGFEEGETPAAFDARIWDVNDATWGSWATQSIDSGSSQVQMLHQPHKGFGPHQSQQLGGLLQ